MNAACTLVLALATLVLAACGGGAGGDARDAAVKPTAAAAAAALSADASAASHKLSAAAASLSAEISPADAADQLMDFAEVYYPQYFPSHPDTATALGYLYRYYADTGIYLGVKDGGVYVLGGSFGIEPMRVGDLVQFITPKARPRATLCDSAATTYSLYATPQAVVGKNVGIALGACTGRIGGTPQWRQTAGPAVALAADRTQTISFDPPQAGNYAFQVSFNDPSGQQRTESIEVPVAAASQAVTGLVVRASLSVRMGGPVSVRAWPALAEGDSVKLVKWTQIDGPAVKLNTETSRLALFTAPQVTRDTVIRLRATLYTTNGGVDSDDVTVLVENYKQAPESDDNALWAGEYVSRVYAYKASGPYAGRLPDCVYDPALNFDGPRYNLCSLNQLPFLAQETAGDVPSVEQVMNRVMVSHDWQGRNFEAFLRAHDARGDFRRMLKSVVSIVISTEIRPSRYHFPSGTIYLDADSFWLTPEERDTVNEAPDFRSDFGKGLRYATLWRYVDGKRNLFTFFDPRLRVTRTLDDVRDESAWLLYHELSHALDYLPPAAYGTLVGRQSVLDNLFPRYQNYQLSSDDLSAMYPLSSKEMQSLGEVQFHGQTATAAQKAYAPDQVAGFLIPDLANDDYNYSTQFEDLAMTSEEFLMQRRLGIRRDFAILDYFSSATSTGSSIIVRWGQRGRIGEPGIRPRVLNVARALTPWVDPVEVDQLLAPTPLRAGESWTANLGASASSSGPRSLGAQPSLQEMWLLGREFQHAQRQRGGPSIRLPRRLQMARLAPAERLAPR